MTDSYLNNVINGKGLTYGLDGTNSKSGEVKEENKEVKNEEKAQETSEFTEEDLKEYNEVLKSVSDILNSIETDESNTETTELSELTISELKDKIDKLTSQISSYDSAVLSLDTLLEAKDALLTEKEKILKQRKEEYDEIEEELKEEEKELDKKDDEINKKFSAIQEQQKIVESITKGDKIDESKLKSVCSAISSLYSDMSELLNTKNEIEKSIDSLNTKLAYKYKEVVLAKSEVVSTSNLIKGINTQKTNIETQKSQTNTELNTVREEYNSKVEADNNTSASTTVNQNNLSSSAGITTVNQNNSSSSVNGITSVLANQEVQLCENMTTQDLINLLSPAEQEYIKDINLSEKLCDGSPRYVFATGKEDNQYHVYDLATSNGPSIVRQKENIHIPVLSREDIRQLGSSIDYNALLVQAYSNSAIAFGNGFIFNFTQGERICYYADDCDVVNSFKACYCTQSPLSLDIDGNGVNTSDEIIDYDIDGDGKTDKIYNSADAVLVFDKDGDGISGKDGSECFGNNTDIDGDGKKDGYANGFEALKALAKENNLINGKDDNVLDQNDLDFLENKFGLKLKLNGYNSEAVSLKDAGITEINLAQTDETEMIDNFDGLGNQLMKQQGATFKINGETREYADIWHKKLDEDIENAKNVFEGNSLSFDISSDYSDLLLQKATRSHSGTQQAILNNNKEYELTMNRIQNIFEDYRLTEEEEKEEEEKENTSVEE